MVCTDTAGVEWGRGCFWKSYLLTWPLTTPGWGCRHPTWPLLVLLELKFSPMVFGWRRVVMSKNFVFWVYFPSPLAGKRRLFLDLFFGLCLWHFGVASILRTQPGIDEAKGKPKGLSAVILQVPWCPAAWILSTFQNLLTLYMYMVSRVLAVLREIEKSTPPPFPWHLCWHWSDMSSCVRGCGIPRWFVTSQD